MHRTSSSEGRSKEAAYVSEEDGGARSIAAANLLALLTRSSADTERVSDARCQTCRVGMPRLASALRSRLLKDPVLYESDLAGTVEDLQMELSPHVTCPERSSCVERTMDELGHLPGVG